MNESKTLSTLEEIRAFSDPYRLEILRTLRDFHRPATVKQIADRMGEVPAKVHYHVKKMEKMDILKLVHTEEINGIMAKYYEPTAKTFVIQSAQMPPELLEEAKTQTQQMCAQIFDDSKKIFLNQIEKKKGEGSILSNTLYLTEEEAKEVMQGLRSFNEKYGAHNKGEGKQPYSLFISFIGTGDQEECESGGDTTETKE